MSGRRKIIAVDFDGTLCETAPFPMIGAPKLEVIDKLMEEQANGARLILWTCRSGEPLVAAIAWCMYQGIFFECVNENVPDMIEAFGNDCRKIFANEYWDDRAVTII